MTDDRRQMIEAMGHGAQGWELRVEFVEWEIRNVIAEGGMLTEKKWTSNIERPTSNVESENIKIQTYDLE